MTDSKIEQPVETQNPQSHHEALHADHTERIQRRSRHRSKHYAKKQVLHYLEVVFWLLCLVIIIAAFWIWSHSAG